MPTTDAPSDLAAHPTAHPTAHPGAAREPLFLDCDTGIDDALTLALLAATPSVELVGVGSVSGNCAAAVGARNTLDLLALLGLDDVPVHVGAHDPLSGAFAGGAPHVHGDDGVGGVAGSLLPRAAGAEPSGTSAAEALVEAARSRAEGLGGHEGPLRVLAIGPLTNLALALEIEPELPRLVRDLTIMGGAAMAPGNVTALAEANIHNDPEAAERVFAAGFDLTMVGLDVTMHHRIEEPQRQQLLAAGTPVTAALAGMLEFYFAFYAQRFGRPCAVLHDPLAAAVLTGDVEASVAPRVPVTVDATHGPGRGQTIADLRGMYHGYPDDFPRGTRVVMEVPGDFGTALVERLLTL